jgi:uncharacterized protein (DUF1330 family)
VGSSESCAPILNPDEAAFREWANSPDYQEISNGRHAAPSAVILLVKGLPKPD